MAEFEKCASSTKGVLIEVHDTTVSQRAYDILHAARDNPEPAMLCHKIRIRPNRQDAQVLRQWFGCVRQTYNTALAAIRDGAIPHKKRFNKFWLRNRFVTSRNIPKRHSYLYETTPKHVREGAIDDLVRAYKANFTRRRNDPQFSTTPTHPLL